MSRPRFLPKTLKAQLLIYGALATLLATALAAWLDFRMAEANTRRMLQEHMLKTAAALASGLERVEPQEAQEILASFHQASQAEEGHEALLIDLQGRVVASSRRESVGKPVEEAVGHPEPGLWEVLAGRQPQSQEEMTHRSILVFDLTLPLHGDPTDPTRVTGALHYVEPYTEYTGLLQRTLLQHFFSIGLLLALLIAPLWFFLHHRILRPVRQIVEANHALAEGRREGMTIPASAVLDNEIGEIARSRQEMLTQLEAAQVELRQRLKELSTLNATAALLSQSLRMEEVLQRILDKVMEITGMEAAEVSLRESETGRLAVRAQRGFSGEWLADEADRPATCLCGWVAYRDEPLCLDDVGAKDARITRPACMREGFRSLCIVPLRAEGQVLGVMSLHSRAVRRHTPQQRDLLAAIGSQIGVALMNIRLYQETQRLSLTDALTGLRNRRALEERLQEELRRVQRYNRPVSVVIADIDHFKDYNDTHGHPQGDVILKQVAALLRAQVRETDFVGRYGGEEFIVLLPETLKAGAVDVAEKIRAAVEAYPFPHAETQPGGRLTISLGAATFPEDLAEAGELIHKADSALYRAKRAGRNQVCGA